MDAALALVGAFILVYAIFAGRLDRMPIGGPILFVAFGLAIGASGLGWLPPLADGETIRRFAELTLALVLFTDAAGTDLAVLRRIERIPIRLLAIGLPLTILAGFGVGTAIFPGLTMIEVALLATMLAPTDAALGKVVVTDKAVPGGIRQGLNVESGLNDGICVPILFLFLALMPDPGAVDNPVGLGLKLFGEAAGIGLLIGLGLVAATVPMLRLAVSRQWLSSAWSQVIVIALAFTCFGTSEALGGSGFISCFVGGMLFGGLLAPHHGRLLDGAEGVGNAFALATWVLFGAVVVGPMLGSFSWSVILYALLCLTVVRMLPVFLALAGSGENTVSRLFMGWFGPRGLASIVFAVIVLGDRPAHGDTITAVVGWTVLLSVILHGLTAKPLSKAFGRSQPTHDER